MFLIRDKVRVYIRYSKIHERAKTFFGLRREDLALLEGFPSFVAFLWDGQVEPLIIPFEQFAPVFNSVEPAGDGQYKTHVYIGGEGTDLHIVRAGRFGVDSHFGLQELRATVLEEQPRPAPCEMSHHQVQTILGAIGRLTGHAIYIPRNDRSTLDWSVAERFDVLDDIPATGRQRSAASLPFIDVLWVHPTRNLLAAAFEVEHSTAIYSALLRFNDVHIDYKLPRAAVVAEAERKESFLRQINRRTFTASGLSEVCLFYSYNEVQRWHGRLRSARTR
jgi:hypothetical protein